MRELEYYCEKFIKNNPEKGRLGVIPNALSCTVDVVLGANPILYGLTPREAFYVVAAISNYEKLQTEGRFVN